MKASWGSQSQPRQEDHEERGWPRNSNSNNNQKRMLLSSRARPPKPLKLLHTERKQPEGQNHSHSTTTTTTTTNYLSLKSLLPSTPVPSPSLPSILPRHGKKPPKLNSRVIVRAILWLSVLIAVSYLATAVRFSSGSGSSSGRRTTRKPTEKARPPRLGELEPESELTFLTSAGKTYEFVETLELPDHPTPLALAVADPDSKHKHKHKSQHHYWTVSIPSDQEFPLASSVYADICSQAEQVARQVAGGRWSSSSSSSSTNNKHRDDEGDFDFKHHHHDPNFLDVDEAQSRHLLPKDRDQNQNQNQEIDSALSSSTSSHELPKQAPVCNKTLTYVLDATDAGLGSALLGLWLSHSLAEREDRAFFIDDTNFPYGNYSTFFEPPTRPACRLPPPSHRVPCPHQARHLVVSAATTKWIFGAAFPHHDHRDPASQREVYDMARRGFEALFKLRKEDDDYVRMRAAKLRMAKGTGTGTGTAPGLGHDGLEKDDGLENGLVGIHIRRGDRHPYEFAYQLGYLPPERYFAVARKLVGQSERWTLMLASDDADMYDLDDGLDDLPANTVRAQQRISLASKKSLGGSGGLGWEGGFFTDVFWSLGLPAHARDQKRVGSPAPTKARPNVDFPKDSPPSSAGRTPAHDVRDYRTHPTDEALQLRQLIGRAYLLDLAMLSQSDKVVCGVSSYTCRILAVMLGWERAFESNDWTNVDGNYGWRALDY